jgi:hypothetical protein
MRALAACLPASLIVSANAVAETFIMTEGIGRAYDIEQGQRTFGCRDPINTKIWYDIITGSVREEIQGINRMGSASHSGGFSNWRS